MITNLSTGFRNGDVSFWAREAESGRAERPALSSDLDADVVVVGGGYTGLWTAYYLKQAKPSWRVVVLEQHGVGYGASGRNGGWLSAEFAGSRERYARESSRNAVVRLQDALVAGIDEVIDVCRAEHIDAGITRGGLISVALTDSQKHRLTQTIAEDRAWGIGPEDLRMLSPAEMSERVRVASARAMAYSPHGARIHPAKLAAGIAAAAERLGVEIYEDTRVLEIRPREARTARGIVRAGYVLRATEGFTAQFDGAKRDWLPMNSVMVVTEPLSDEVWTDIGWENAELLGTLSHAFLYLQRTADNRIAIGGRGNPYRFGSRTDTDATARSSDVAALWASLTTLFPAVKTSSVAHAWCGTLGVARDWCATVDVDHEHGLGFAGGYAGHGVTMSNLAGRTLRDLVLGEKSDLTSLPYVGRRVRRWEPEPLRWLGVQALYALYRRADRTESERGGPTSPLARVADVISGR